MTGKKLFRITWSGESGNQQREWNYLLRLVFVSFSLRTEVSFFLVLSLNEACCCKRCVHSSLQRKLQIILNVVSGNQTVLGSWGESSIYNTFWVIMTINNSNLLLCGPFTAAWLLRFNLVRVFLYWNTHVCGPGGLVGSHERCLIWKYSSHVHGHVTAC